MKTQQSLVFFGFVFEAKLEQENHVIIVTSLFSKSPVFKMLTVHTKGQCGVFKFLQFEQRFLKALLS